MKTRKFVKFCPNSRAKLLKYVLRKMVCQPKNYSRPHRNEFLIIVGIEKEDGPIFDSIEIIQGYRVLILTY